jgi:hypothetical protein
MKIIRFLFLFIFFSQPPTSNYLYFLKRIPLLTPMLPFSPKGITVLIGSTNIGV